MLATENVVSCDMDKKRKQMLLAFGETIRQRRKALGLTQEELSRRTGLHRSYIADVEGGRRNVTLLNLEGFASGLEFTLEAMFREIGLRLQAGA